MRCRAAVLFPLLGACSLAAATDSLLDMAPLQADTALPAISVVRDGDTSWTAAPPLFSIADSGAGASARGWLAVSDSAVLLKVVVADRSHENNRSGNHIYDGDCLQLALDGLGDGGSLQPPDALDLPPDGASYGFALTPAGPQVFQYHSGYNLEAGVGGMFGDAATQARAAIVRDGQAQTTTYRVSVPWSELHVAAGAAPLLGIAVLMNDGSGKARHQFSWGTLAGGDFRPGLFKRVRIDWPATGRVVLKTVSDAVWAAGQRAEVNVMLGTPEAVTITAAVGEQQARLQVPARADAGRTVWYSVRMAFPEPPAAPVKLSVSVSGAKGKVLASRFVSVRSVANGLLAKPLVSTKVVKTLRVIAASRRGQLRDNPQGKSRQALNATIPEINDVEVSNVAGDGKLPDSLRVVCWNAEFGTHWQEAGRLFGEHPALKAADVVLLSEVDDGCGRSGNQHAARLLAQALHMNCAFGVEFLEFAGSIAGEADSAAADSVGYTGNAILCRAALRDVKLVRFPQLSNVWYHTGMRRLGGRMALMATVTAGGKPLRLVSAHLESNTGDPRAGVYEHGIEVGMLLGTLPKGMPVIVGGDCNARPAEAMFATLRQEGFDVSAWNDTTVGTTMRRRGNAWVVSSSRIDYLLGRDLAPVRDATSPLVVPALYPADSTAGVRLSDHAVVTVRAKVR